jgi:hypothetical protein
MTKNNINVLSSNARGNPDEFYMTAARNPDEFYMTNEFYMTASRKNTHFGATLW